MLSSNQIEVMRETQEAALPQTCTRRRAVLIRDGRGGHTEGTSEEAEYVCRVAPTKGREIEIASRITSELTLTVTLPHDADVQPRDRLVIGDRELNVVAVLSGGTWTTALRVLAVEVT